jgi:hypothetical protein
MPFRAYLTNIDVGYLGNYRTHPSMQRNIGDARGLKVANEVGDNRLKGPIRQRHKSLALTHANAVQ